MAGCKLLSILLYANWFFQTAFYFSICKLVLFQVANLLPPLVHTQKGSGGEEKESGKEKKIRSYRGTC